MTLLKLSNKRTAATLLPGNLSISSQAGLNLNEHCVSIGNVEGLKDK